MLGGYGCTKRWGGQAAFYGLCSCVVLWCAEQHNAVAQRVGRDQVMPFAEDVLLGG